MGSFGISFSDENKLIAALSAGNIDHIDKLMTYPNLDCGMLRFMIGRIDKNTKVTEYIPVDTSICSSNNCSIHKQIESITDLPEQLRNNELNNLLDEQDLINTYRMKCATCPYKNVHNKVTYINPKQKYKYYYNKNRNNARFTKLEIKVMLLLQAWPSELVQKEGENDAFIPDVYLPHLASILECSVQHLYDCLAHLGNLSMIELSKSGCHCYNIYIPGYYIKFKTAKTGGSGYIQISKEILSSLLYENNINVLRAKLYQLISLPFTEAEPKVKNITSDEIRSFMPDYVNYSTLYDQTFNNDLFGMKYNKGTKRMSYIIRNCIENVVLKKKELAEESVDRIAFLLDKLKPTFINDSNVRSNTDPKYQGYIKNYIKLHRSNILAAVSNKKTLADFLPDCVHLCIEYGYANVAKAIHQVEVLYRMYGTQIKNAGAILRHQCCYNRINGLT